STKTKELLLYFKFSYIDLFNLNKIKNKLARYYLKTWNELVAVFSKFDDLIDKQFSKIHDLNQHKDV
ncbi:hypothetical protein SS7213T_07051, partial [Staphylococcus simiae CCM 7213 = CCUG 51256]